MRGSSPRMRGKRLKETEQATGHRLIPAYAGKTPLSGARTCRTTAHPRVCGENLRALSRLQVNAGSSPRMRGKQRRRPIRLPGRGLIPAYAGKTRCRQSAGRFNPAHPRVCGENQRPCQSPVNSAGSSPRMRGKRVKRDPKDLPGGLIPAYAGKTSTVRRPARSCSAHPRVCGENCGVPGLFLFCLGSSPRMRGKPLLWITLWKTPGLIPAYAGKTGTPACNPPKTRAHPRVCGEN